MTPSDILILIACALLLGSIPRKWGRTYFLMAASILVIYWLQPSLPKGTLGFWLPTATLALTTFSWALTTPTQARTWRSNWPALAIMAGVIIGVDATRYLSTSTMITESLLPRIQVAIPAVISIVIITGAIMHLRRFNAVLRMAGLAILICLFIIMKTPALTERTFSTLAGVFGEIPKRAQIIDLRWLGFSYLAFRLIHTIRERQTGRLPAVSLAEYTTYVIFFPAFNAGPIDRLERFVQDLHAPQGRSLENLSIAFQRIVFGMFKKFVIADGLAMFSLNATSAILARNSAWTWIMLYAYAFQIYLDFSGYTDIAIGIGRLAGIQLPENFAKPYLQPNLTQFWNGWHMTLTQWFRAYFFNPLIRALRSHKLIQATPLIILVAQVSTMVLIGLWHGVTWNFILWGLWHGVGLFVQNRWSEWMRTRFATRRQSALTQKFLTVAGTLLTFHYVALGWVLFVLPSPSLARDVFFKLFGVL